MKLHSLAVGRALHKPDRRSCSTSSMVLGIISLFSVSLALFSYVHVNESAVGSFLKRNHEIKTIANSLYFPILFVGSNNSIVEAQVPVAKAPDSVSEALYEREVLLNHPLHKLSATEKATLALEDQMVYLHSQPECQGLPIFTSMANVFSDLYWQL
jgi:hypothetical protein